MEFRKLIKFGGNSFIISLPKKWIMSHGLSKGDLIYLDQKNGNILLSAEQGKRTREKIEATISIEKNTDDATIERKLFGAYVNGANKIIFNGVNLSKHSNKIIERLKNYVALEIIEQTSTKIIAKTYIDAKEVKIISFIRRIDNTIRSMMADLKLCFESPRKVKKEIAVTISQREENIDKIRKMLYRILTERLKHPNISTDEKPLDNFKNWEIVKSLEKISNQLKHMANKILENLKNNKENPCDEDVVNVIETIKTMYDDIMKYLYKNDVDGGDKMSRKLKSLRNELRNHFEDNGRDRKQILFNLLEHLRDLNRLTY